jgi:hypothetical protein
MLTYALTYVDVCCADSNAAGAANLYGTLLRFLDSPNPYAPLQQTHPYSISRHISSAL